MLTESQNHGVTESQSHGITDMLKTINPPKKRFAGGIITK